MWGRIGHIKRCCPDNDTSSTTGRKKTVAQQWCSYHQSTTSPDANWGVLKNKQRWVRMVDTERKEEAYVVRRRVAYLVHHSSKEPISRDDAKTCDEGPNVVLGGVTRHQRDRCEKRPGVQRPTWSIQN